jgi:uncharacterized pyridoxamine 5'-phosphate oxidase family protein
LFRLTEPYYFGVFIVLNWLCTMDFPECIRFATENPITYIATVEKDQPRVRAFSMWFADQTGFYYHTGTPKKVCQQLQKNPKVELCFFSPDYPPAGKMMRVTGKVEFLSEESYRNRLYSDRPWVRSIIPDDQAARKLAIFRVPHGEVQFWTMENNMQESETPRICF